MSKIHAMKESFEDRTRSLIPNEDPSSFIASVENEPVFSTTGSKPMHDTVVVSGRSLFGTRFSESNSTKSRKDSTINELTQTNGSNISVINSNRYVASPYNYAKIDEFFRKESYFSRSIYRQIETMMRNRYEINSDDRKALTIVKREFARISRESKIGVDQFIFQVARNILKYGICVTRKLKSQKTKKITRLICLKPQNIIFKYDNQTGALLSVTDRAPSQFGKVLNKIFKNIRVPNSNIIQQNEIALDELGMCMIYDPGEDVFPEPPCFQMLDDILTLRSLEETVELLAFQFGSPLLHVAVGSKEAPVTKDQMIEIHNEFVRMAQNGMITTDYNTKVDVVNLQSGIADLMPYIEHFKRRVLSGASSSQVSIGESDTGTRSSTESIDNALADRCSYISSIIANMINTSIIPDILMSNGYKEEEIYDASGDFLVKMEFLDVDVSKMISKENHALSLYQGNILTSAETRRLIMRPPLSKADFNDTYFSNVQAPLRLVGANVSGSDSSTAATKSKDQPSNQYGNKLSPGSTKK